MIKGKNIILRTMAEEDLDEFETLRNNIPEMGEYWDLGIWPKTRMKQKFIETGYWEDDFGILLITTKDNAILGDILFAKSDKFMNGYEIAYNIFLRKNRGKGYMAEALRIFTSYLFELKPIGRLQLSIATENIASRSVAEKCGYKFEGTLRNYFFVRGKFMDFDRFSILKDECPSLKDVLSL